MSKRIIIPGNEGIDHINVYSKSRTELGRLFSNFYRHKLDTSDGRFMSVEAYFHYLLVDWNNCDIDNAKEYVELLMPLRLSSGYSAMQIGQELIAKYGQREREDFVRLIYNAIEQKIRDNKDILLKYSDWYDLPYYHYYVYGDKVVDVTDKYRWFVDACSRIRYKILEEEGIVI